jgi:selenide,water dikinase
VTIEIDASSVPLLEGAFELAAAGMLTSGDKTNREYVGTDVQLSGSVDQTIVKLLFDPQTAGGMLIAIANDRSEALLSWLRKHYPRAQKIGRIREKGQHSVVVN